MDESIATRNQDSLELPVEAIGVFLDIKVKKDKLNLPRNGNNNKFTYSPVNALGHTPPYKIHKYFARRPWNVFNQLVKQYSYENETILDPFCGGGVTIYEGLKEGRKVIGYDLNPLSIFVVKNMLKKDEDPFILESAIDNCMAYLMYLYKDYYSFTKNGEKIEIDWFEVCFKVKCNYCGAINLLSNKNKIANGVYKCSNLKCKSLVANRGGFQPKDCKRVGYQYIYKIGYNHLGEKLIEEIKEKDSETISDHVKFLKREVKKAGIEVPRNPIPLNWDRQYEDQLNQKGIVHFEDLFTERNLLINVLLLQYIKTIENSIGKENYELLRICFSNTIKDTNIMSFTNDAWQSGKPTTWSKHAYWIPSQFCEVNIINSFKNAVQRVRASLSYNSSLDIQVKHADSFLNLKTQNTLLVNSSITESDIPNDSVDAIITDPPYGSNVQYLELSHFWYVWNSDLYQNKPDFSQEAVSNRKKKFEGSKSMYDYENNLFTVFSKSYKVLKPNRHMVLTFNNKDISAWLSLLFSIFKSGFTLEQDGLYFQDGVVNYKQTAHTKSEGSPYGDFIYDFKKTNPIHKLKNYTSEDAFKNDLDGIFKKWISKDDVHRNDLLLDMFLEAIPVIEGFSKSYLLSNQHDLFSFFNKDYLKNLY
jgi:putative DNA methylase